MNKSNIIKKNEEGMALVAVIMVMLVSFILAAMVLSMSDSQTRTEVAYEGNTQSVQAAEAGIHKYLWSLNKEGGSIDLDTEISYPDSNPRYVFTLDEIEDSSIRKVVKSTGWSIYNPDIKYSVSAEIKKRSFTNHVYFTNHEDPNIWWNTGDKCYGPYRSNTSLYVMGRPEFYGEVFYKDEIKKYNSSANPYYKYGTTQQAPITFPASNNELKVLAQSEGLYFRGRTSIMMNSNGTLRIWNARDGSTNIYNIPSNGVIYVDGDSNSNKWNTNNGNVFISGSLKGRLTVAAANNIYITDYDPTYSNFNTARNRGQTNGCSYASVGFNFDASNQRFNNTGSGNDMLGLIANKNVEILTYGWFNNSSARSASGNINVHAAVMAINGSFQSSKHDFSLNPDSGPPTIILRGALIQNIRGPVGMTDGSGYNKDYAHDIRMEGESPPNFLEPAESGWEVNAWN